LILLLFVLGTTPVLLTIGLSSVKLLEKPHFSNLFLKVAGILVIFFALYNINAQFNVLGLPSLDDISIHSSDEEDLSEASLPEIVDGKQILKMNASASGYSPRILTVRAGIPVVWEIKDTAQQDVQTQ
jgi:hypothetical protein